MVKTMFNQAMIIGWSHSQFGKLPHLDTESLMAEVIPIALDHAGISGNDIDGIYVGVMNNGFDKQDFQAALPAISNPDLAFTPSTRIENACGTGSAAIHAAMDFIESGRGKIALVIGAEKMTGLSTPDVSNILLGASYCKEESNPCGFAGVFGGIAQLYFDTWGNKSEELAMIAAKNHLNALDNPFAHLHKNLGFEFCNTISDKNPLVAGPLRRTDCSLVSDGAAVLILAEKETALSMKRAIKFRSRIHTNDFMPLSRRKSPTAFDGAAHAWKLAKKTAGITLDDLDLVETHDCFTIAEMIEYEAMGLVLPGEGYRVAREGWHLKGGKLPINPSGGLKAKGHPIGATGVSQHVMACLQLTGDAQAMQIPNTKLAGVFNMGGAAVSNYVSILEQVK